MRYNDEIITKPLPGVWLEMVSSNHQIQKESVPNRNSSGHKAIVGYGASGFSRDRTQRNGPRIPSGLAEKVVRNTVQHTNFIEYAC